MITKRLKEYFEYKGLSYYKVEKTLQVSTGSISGAVKHGRNLGSKVLRKLLIVYPDLSAEWLLRGTGNMLLTSTDRTEGENLRYQMLSNDWLIDKAITFFNLKSKHELISFFERIFKSEAPDDADNGIDLFERKVLEIIDKRYGSTLENAEELYALYLQTMMREGENLIERDFDDKGKQKTG